MLASQRWSTGNLKTGETYLPSMLLEDDVAGYTVPDELVVKIDVFDRKEPAIPMMKPTYRPFRTSKLPSAKNETTFTHLPIARGLQHAR